MEAREFNMVGMCPGHIVDLRSFKNASKHFKACEFFRLEQ